jgi:deoxyribonuclease-1
MARNLTITIGLVAALSAAVTDAGNAPCAGAKGGVAACQESRFLCRDGSLSASRKVCNGPGAESTAAAQWRPPAASAAAPAASAAESRRTAATDQAAPDTAATAHTTAPADQGATPAAGPWPHTAGSFEAAKQILYGQVYYDHRRTLYCGCQYDAGRTVDLGSCGLQGLGEHSRAARIEAEHVFPAEQFGHFRQCWREPSAFPKCTRTKGQPLSRRACCMKVDPTFRTAHNDLQNLYPEDGFLNGARSNFNWGMTTGGKTFGTCDMRFDASLLRVQPPPPIRGVVARTMFYMSGIYGFRLSRQDQQLYLAWNNQYPPEAWEIERNQRIRAIQGVGNVYVEEYQRR